MDGVEIRNLDQPAIREDGLQLEENRSLQRRFWQMQRIAWLGFGIVVLVALLGLTGSGGPLHMQVLRFAHAEVELPRITRWEGSDGIVLRYLSDTTNRDIELNDAFFQRFAVEEIQPQPASSLLTKGGQKFLFDAEDIPPHQVRFELRAMHFGWTEIDVTIGDETRSAHVIVLP